MFSCLCCPLPGHSSPNPVEQAGPSLVVGGSVAPWGLRGCPRDPTGFGLRGDPGGGVKVVLLLCSGRDYFWKEANSVFSVFVFKGDVNPIL